MVNDKLLTQKKYMLLQHNNIPTYNYETTPQHR